MPPEKKYAGKYLANSVLIIVTPYPSSVIVSYVGREKSGYASLGLEESNCHVTRASASTQHKRHAHFDLGHSTTRSEHKVMHDAVPDGKGWVVISELPLG